MAPGPWPASTAAWSRAGSVIARGVCFFHQRRGPPQGRKGRNWLPAAVTSVPAVCQAPPRHLLLSQPLGQGGEQGAPGAQVQSVCRARDSQIWTGQGKADHPDPPQWTHPESVERNIKIPIPGPLLMEAGSPQSCLPTQSALRNPGLWTGER